MVLFWLLFALDGVLTLALFLLLLASVADQLDGIGLLILLVGVAVPVAVMLGGLRLKARGRLKTAIGVLLILAVPGSIFGGLVIYLASNPGLFR